MHKKKFKLNPNLRVSRFDDRGGNKFLYETIDKEGHYRSFTITSKVHQILCFFENPQSLDSVIDGEKASLHEKEIEAFKKMVQNCFEPNNILVEEHFQVSSTAELKRRKPSYMIFKITLLAPNLVNFFSRPFLFLFKTHCMFSVFWVFIISQYFFYFSNYTVVSNSEPLITTLVSINSIDIIFTFLLTFLGLLYHELGHAAAAIRNNCKNVDIGVGLYICFIVFYADLSEIWRLDRRKRLLVDVGGLYFQMVFMSILFFFYIATGSLYFYLANVALGVSFLWNLNPFFRLDGYWIASDFFGVENLRNSAQLTTGKLRNLLYRNKIEFKDQQERYLFIYYLLSKLAFLFLVFWFSFQLIDNVLFTIADKLERVRSFLNLEDFLVALGGLFWSALMLFFAAYLAIILLKSTWGLLIRFRKFLRFRTSSN